MRRKRMWLSFRYWLHCKFSRKVRVVATPRFGEKHPVRLEDLRIYSKPATAIELAEKITALGMSRRETMRWLESHIYFNDVSFLRPDGVPLGDAQLPDLRDLVGDDTGKWFGDFQRWPNRIFKQAIQRKVQIRLQWIDAALKIAEQRRGDRTNW